MKQTVLHAKHEQLKARMTDFQGWQVPLQYSDPLDEYHAVRAAAGLFDITCLGRIEVSGAAATSLLQKVLTRNVTKIAEGSVHYGLVCNEAGGILDDLLVFRLPPEGGSSGRYLLTTNAGNTEKMILWLRQHASGKVAIHDKTIATAHLSLQGPQSPHIVETLFAPRGAKLKLRSVREMDLLDTRVLISRTGYTGEQGYEFIAPADRAEALWDAIMTAGVDKGVLPCGFACRDMLRMEAGHLLYGSDIDVTRSPFDANLAPFVDLKKRDFIGRDALLKLKAEGVKQTLAGFVLLDKGVPKSGGSIFSESREIGVVTSGCHSPHLRNGIGLGYVVSRYMQSGQEIEIEVKDREIAAKIMDLPFYRKK